MNAKKKSEEQPVIEKRVAYLERVVGKLLKIIGNQFGGDIKALEKEVGVDINEDGRIGGVRILALISVLLVSVVAVVAVENQVERWIADEGNDAVLTLEADQGDDAADELQIIMKADGNGEISVGGTTVLDLIPGDASASVTAVSGVTATTYDGPINKTVLTLAGVPLIIDGSSGNGWGTANLCTTMQAYLHVVGVKVDDFYINPDADGETDQADGGDFSLGTTATADNTLATTEINLLASTSLDPITNAVDAVQVVDIVPFDGTASGQIIHLNALIDDGDVAASSTNAAYGTVTLWWLNMGDN